MDITRVLPQIVSSLPTGSVIRFYRLNLVASTDNRVVDLPEVKPIVEEALELRAKYRVPFWEAVLLLSRRGTSQATKAILDAASHHQPMSQAMCNLAENASSLSHERLAELSRATAEGQALVVSSRIATTQPGQTYHIPMLDFRIRPSIENEQLAIDILHRLKRGGTLLNSGNSYHFYGNRLLRGDQELVKFLGRASLFSPFVDQRWIAHQLIEGACALRVSPGKSFKSPPKVVRDVAGDIELDV